MEQIYALNPKPSRAASGGVRHVPGVQGVKRPPAPQAERGFNRVGSRVRFARASVCREGGAISRQAGSAAPDLSISGVQPVEPKASKAGGEVVGRPTSHILPFKAVSRSVIGLSLDAPGASSARAATGQLVDLVMRGGQAKRGRRRRRKWRSAHLRVVPTQRARRCRGVYFKTR